jgi:hypothetical protein
LRRQHREDEDNAFAVEHPDGFEAGTFVGSRPRWDDQRRIEVEALRSVGEFKAVNLMLRCRLGSPQAIFTG